MNWGDLIRTLTIDIETSPNIGDLWALWNQTIGLSQLRESSRTLCWAAKWYGEKEILFGAEWSDFDFIEKAYELLDEADVVIGYNHVSFDLKTLNKDFALRGWGPPSPYQSIDLLKIVKHAFRFPSNKLDYVAQRFGIGKKVSHSGHQLWVEVMAGSVKAQKKMEAYCKGDVYPLTEKLYDCVKAWAPNHPNRSLYTSSECGRCERGRLHKRGLTYTANGAFQTYRCGSCGGWSRDTKRVEGVDSRNI